MIISNKKFKFWVYLTFKSHLLWLKFELFTFLRSWNFKFKWDLNSTINFLIKDCYFKYILNVSEILITPVCKLLWLRVTTATPSCVVLTRVLLSSHYQQAPLWTSHSRPITHLYRLRNIDGARLWCSANFSQSPCWHSSLGPIHETGARHGGSARINRQGARRISGGHYW